MLSTLLSNPHGYIRFNFNNTYFEGYINTTEMGDYNEKASFEVIAKSISDKVRIFESGNIHTFESGNIKISEP